MTSTTKKWEPKLNPLPSRQRKDLEKLPGRRIIEVDSEACIMIFGSNGNASLMLPNIEELTETPLLELPSYLQLVYTIYHAFFNYGLDGEPLEGNLRKRREGVVASAYALFQDQVLGLQEAGVLPGSMLVQ